MIDMPEDDDPKFGHSPWYDQDGRPMTPTAIGYEAAAFYRYRARTGAADSKKIELYPSSQWGLLA